MIIYKIDLLFGKIHLKNLCKMRYSFKVKLNSELNLLSNLEKKISLLNDVICKDMLNQFMNYFMSLKKIPHQVR